MPPPNVDKMKDQKNVEGLISALKDDDTTVRYRAAPLAYPRKSRNASRRNKSKRQHQSVNKKHYARNYTQGNEAVPRNRYFS